LLIARLFKRIEIMLDPDSAEARNTRRVEGYSEEDFVLRS